MYAQVLLKKKGQVVRVRTAQRPSQINFFCNLIDNRNPEYEIEVIYKNFIDTSGFRSAHNQKEKAKYMDWWGNKKCTEAEELSLKILGRKDYMSLTKEEIKTIYDNHK